MSEPTTVSRSRDNPPRRFVVKFDNAIHSISLGGEIDQMHAARMDRVLELARLKGAAFDSMLR